MGRWRRSFRLGAAVLLIGLAACGSDDQADDETATTAFEPKPTIRLVVNDWTASALDVAIAEQLIERHLGYPVVPVRMDDSTAIYNDLADGDLDAILEIWPSTMTDRDRRFFEAGMVDDIGDLGSVGKVGWWVPQYVIDDDPSLATWEGYDSASVAARFATPETSPDGRFVGTSEEYRQLDAALIENLGLPFQVEFTESEGATKAELEEKTSAGEPILLYWWTPTAAVRHYDLVNVALPERTDACAEAPDAQVDCDYPDDVLFKAASPGLGAKAPVVLAFLDAFTLSTPQQLDLLDAVEFGGLTVDQAAAEWIEANEAIWAGWISAAEGDDGGVAERAGGGGAEAGGPDGGDVPDEASGDAPDEASTEGEGGDDG